MASDGREVGELPTGLLMISSTSRDSMISSEYLLCSLLV